jgi:nucleoid-associated protein YgaU
MTPERQEASNPIEETVDEAMEKMQRLAQEAAEPAATPSAEEVKDEMADLRKARPTAPQRTYVVQPGDYLEKIAKEIYGDWERWKDIYEANKDQIEDPDLIHPGQKLRIP